MNKHLFICFSFISLTWANTPQTFSGQKIASSNSGYHFYRQIENSNLAYVYGVDGDRIVYINFNRRGTLISKTTYDYVNKKKNFIYNDNCEERDCHQFLH